MVADVPSTIADVIAGARRLGLVTGDVDPDFQVEVAVVHGAVHYPAWGGCPELRVDRTQKAARQWRPLTSLASVNCRQCRDDFADPGGILTHALAATIHVVQAAALLDALDDADLDTRATVVRTAGVWRAVNLAKNYIANLADDDAPEVTTERLTAVLEGLVDRVAAFSDRPEYRDVVARAVADVSLPEAIREVVTLDSTPTALMMRRVDLPDSVEREAMWVFTRREVDDTVLVVCPRFVADYLQRRAGSSVYTVTTDLRKATPAVVETAVGLWDPHGGQLACVRQCLTAAERLAGGDDRPAG